MPTIFSHLQDSCSVVLNHSLLASVLQPEGPGSTIIARHFGEASYLDAIDLSKESYPFYLLPGHPYTLD